jgi:LysR family glycine cleavage system transcriptional activator
MTKFSFPLLNTLRAFEAATRLQSVAKAADELHVTAGSVSRNIKNLELHVGHKLFERTHNTIVSTKEGESLFIAVDAAFSLIQRALTQLNGRQDPNRLVISVDPDFARLWLMPRLAEFHAIVPNIIVEIMAERVPPSVPDSRTSCAIHYSPVGLEDGPGEMLFQSRLFPVCAKNRPSAPRLDSLNDLRHHTLLHDRSFAEWEQFLRGCEATYDINVNTGIVVSDTALCLDAAARGQGVAIGDDFLAATFLSEGRLVKPFAVTISSKNAYYLTVFDNAANHPSVNVFRMWLLQTIQRRRTELRLV